MDWSHLTPESSLGELPLYDCAIEDSVLAMEVDRQFEATPHLPGVIILSQGQPTGMVSQQRFHQRVSRRFGYEVYLNRPMRVLMSFVKTPILQLPHSCKINEAAHQAISRPRDLIAEPIVVGGADGRPRLLDVHLLLLAHSHIFALVTQTVQQQRLALSRSVAHLRQAQQQSAQTNRLLEMRTIAIKDHNQLLEHQQAELRDKNSRIAALNDRFAQIAQLLASEGHQAFGATLEGIDVISDNTQQVIAIAQALSSELRTVHETSLVIKAVSKQARYLALQVAILVNQAAGSPLSGVSRVASDISMLSGQTFEAGQRMDVMAGKLQSRIQDLSQLAHQEATVAQSLMQRFERTQAAIEELDELLQGHEQAKTELAAGDNSHHNRELRLLMERLTQARSALTELEAVFDPAVGRP